MKVENLTIEESTNNTIYVTTVAGTNGTDGVTGPTGTNGTNGTNGTDGVTGPTGTNGTNGTDGVTGPTGSAGDGLQNGEYYGNYLYWNTNSEVPSWQVGNTEISIGKNCGKSEQGYSSVAIGNKAGQNNQPVNSIAIGNDAGYINTPITSTIYTVGKGTTTNNTIFYNDNSSSSSGWVPINNNFTQCNSVCINSDDTETCVVGTGESNAIAFIKGNNEIIYSDQTIIGSGNCISYSKNAESELWIVGGTIGTDTTKNSVLAVVINMSPKQYYGVQDSANSLSTCYTVLMNTANIFYIGGFPTISESSSVYSFVGNFKNITSTDNTILSTCYKLKKYNEKLYACGQGSDYNLTLYNGKTWGGISVLDQDGNQIFTTIYDILMNDDISILVGSLETGVIAYKNPNISYYTVTATIFTTSANSITYNSDQQIYEVVGEGTNTNAYSYDGIEWIPYTIEGLDSGLSVDLKNTTYTSINSNTIAIGNEAGYSTQGSHAIAIGYRSGYHSQGASSISIGNYAGSFSQGYSSLAIGNDVGNVQGTGSVVIGNSSGNSQGNMSIVIGQDSGVHQGDGSVAIGNSSGNSQGNMSIVIGQDSGVRQGDASVAIGFSAGTESQGNASVAIGYKSGSNVQGHQSIAIGYKAGQQYQNNNSIAMGIQSGANVQGLSSVAIGNSAGAQYQNDNSIAMGIQAGENVQGAESIAIGVLAGQQYQTPNSIAIGTNAGENNIQNINKFYTVGKGNNAIFFNNPTPEQPDNWIPITSTFSQCNSVIINSNGTEIYFVGIGDTNAIGYILGLGNTDIKYETQTVIDKGNCIILVEGSNNFKWIAGGTVGQDGTNSVIAVKIINNSYIGIQDSGDLLSTCYTLLYNNSEIYAGGTPANSGSSSVYLINFTGFIMTSLENTILSTCYKLKNYNEKIYASGEGSEYTFSVYNNDLTWTPIAVNDSNDSKIFTTIYDFFIDEKITIFVGKYVIAEGVETGIIAYNNNEVQNILDQKYTVVVPTIFTKSANSIIYNSVKKIFVSVGEGENTNATSENGVDWIATKIEGLDRGLSVDLNFSDNNNSSTIAIGYLAGQNFQGNQSVSIGSSAGNYTQGNFAIAIGPDAGNKNQGNWAVAVGNLAGQYQQRTGAIALGFSAGREDQGDYSIAIGYNSGIVGQPANSIILNASGSELNPTPNTGSGFYVSPISIDIDSINTNMLCYNTSTKEITSNVSVIYNNAGPSLSTENTGTGPGYINNTTTESFNLFLGNIQGDSPNCVIQPLSQFYVPANLSWKCVSTTNESIATVQFITLN
jgi:hypothetical protein